MKTVKKEQAKEKSIMNCITVREEVQSDFDSKKVDLPQVPSRNSGSVSSFTSDKEPEEKSAYIGK